MLERKLKILITVDPEIPVPPSYYGGIERIVYMLICELANRNHEIHLFAHPASKVPARLIAYRGKRSRSFRDTIRNTLDIKNYIKKIGGLDIIHSFSRLAYLFPLMRSSIPKIQSYQRRVTPRSVHLGILLAGKTLTFSACSNYCAGTGSSIGGRWKVIPNGVPIKKYKFISKVPPEAPLVFLGRIERVKGAHTAIEVAKRSGCKLIIAGNHAEYGHEYEYFTKEILPRCDGDRIQYIGPVDDTEKNELLSNARTLLFPVEFEEPFGIVMAEAFACGTPVIGLRRGAVPEVIQDGVNGFVCNTAREMVDAVKRLPLIKRERCRKIVEDKYSDGVIAEEYLSLYKSLLNEMIK